jgi:hypothetical protein
VHLIFNSLLGSTATKGLTLKPVGGYSNVTFISAAADDMVLSHELGHKFQLPHVPSFWLEMWNVLIIDSIYHENLMCDTLLIPCPLNPSPGLLPDQVVRARKGALALSEQ